MSDNYKTKLNDITTFCFDVDGVFTDGIVILSTDGDQLRTANVRDGYAVQLAAKKGYRVAIITGGRSEAVKKRFEGLGVKDVFLSSSNKVKVFNDYLAKEGIKADEVCYMGDDIPDYRVMGMAGLATCPNDAAPEIREIADYISPVNGGKGCVRDILEQTMKVQGKWFDDESHEW
ncbi:MAG: HAD-IIIA family hydrolase [Flavobacteriales bacterium]|nr:HAD-IIIA family hydrolase [Flavobacteriales bacterium]